MRNLLQIQGPGMKTSRVPDSGFCSHRVITYMQQNPCHKVTMDNVPTSQTGAHAMSLQLCPTLCDPMDRSLPGSSVHGILQARILEWVAMPSLQGMVPTQGLNPHLLHLHWQVGSLPLAPPRKPPQTWSQLIVTAQRNGCESDAFYTSWDADSVKTANWPKRSQWVRSRTKIKAQIKASLTPSHPWLWDCTSSSLR